MRKACIHLVTGGQRSGKSRFAEELALQKSENPIYLATSRVWDEEFAKRIEKHRQQRSDQWITIEEQMDIASLDFNGKVALLDCITLWLTNIFDGHSFDKELTLQYAKNQWDELIKREMELIVVGNEIGMGVIPMEKSTRSFVDLHGEMNQFIAQSANEVTLMVSGIPVKVKG